MDSRDEQYEELQRRIAALSERVSKLEQSADLRSQAFEAPETSEPVAPQPFSTPEGETDLPPRRNAELESRIGGHWLNRVGIVAVLVGVSYFLKYAVDNEWIGAAGRLIAGLAGGLAIVLWSEYVRRRGYEIYSHSLKAVGIGVLYLSLWASSQLYALVPNGLAFFAMTIVTAATAGMAIWQNSEVIAAFAVLGGFITPLVLSTGVNNAIGLFGYLTMLDLGVLLISRYRPWPRVLLESYVATFLLYFIWHDRFYSDDQFAVAAIALTVFYAIYLLVPFIVRASADKDAFLLLAIGNASIYFLEVYELFRHAGDARSTAILAVALSGVYFLMSQFRYISWPLSAHLHRALAACFLVIAVPIGLEAKWITIGWLILAGSLMWVSRRTEGGFLKYLVTISLTLGILRLLIVDDFAATRLIFNERMLTYGVAVMVLGFVAWALMAGNKQRERQALAIVIVTINVLALMALNHEITDSWRRQSLLTTARDFAYSALWMAYGAGLIFVGFWRKSRFLRWQALILIALTIGKVFVYDAAELERGYRILSLIALGLLLLATSFFYQRTTVSRR